MSKVSFYIEGNHIRRFIHFGNDDYLTVDEKTLHSFSKAMSSRMQFDTGWLPPGLLQYTQSGIHSQAVLCLPPGINRINWADSEEDEPEQYLLAQPWRLLIADMLEGSLQGVRMFYSPVQITSPYQTLYHQNLPNINCMGYRGVSVGWVCLYHNESWKNFPISEKIYRIIERCSGAEAYNDANMDITDGPRFYQSQGAPSYLTCPHEWEQKSLSEGFEWTLDENVWIPVRVRNRDDQYQHYDEGEFLTVEMAMNGKYNAYYGDEVHPKPAAELRQGNRENAGEIIQKSYHEAIKRGPTRRIVKDEPVPKVVAEAIEN